MNAEQLLQNFDRIAESPGSIAHLRRFILDLAVRGKLVEQDPNDEPASELLKRIQVEKARLEKEGKIKKQKLLPKIKLGNVPYNLPEGWEWVKLGFCMLKITDGTHHSPLNTESGDFLYISAKNIKVDGILLENATYVAKEVHEEIFARCNPEYGDVLYIKDGATTGVVTINNLCEPFSMLSSVALLKPPKFIFNKFLCFSMKSPLFYSEMRAEMTGVAITRVTLQKLQNAAIPLPPLPEQHRIVAKVDELMGLCDRLEAAQKDRESQRDRLVASSLHHLNQATEKAEFRDRAQFYFNNLPKLTTRSIHIKQLRQTILNLAVCGKLVPQDPNDEAAEELYNRLSLSINILNQQSGTRRKKEISSSNQEFFLELFPLSWIVTNFDSVNAIASGVAKGKNYRGIETLAYPYLRVANVQRGYLDLSLIKEIEIRANEYDRYRLESGDVLMTEGGDWDKLGRAAIWHEEVPNCIHQNHIYRIRSANKQELLPQWITLFANSHIGRSYFEDASKQTTNLASINMTQLRSCPLPLPPTQEQHRIVAKVDELMGLCDRLEAQIDITETDSRRLLESLLHEATSGIAVKG